MNDPIGDLIIRIKNAGETGNEFTTAPFSKLRLSICEFLEKEGYIKSFSKKGKKPVKSLEIEIAYEDGLPKITGVKRVSKLSKRIYTKAKEIRPVKNGFGLLVLSTPKGIMSGSEARKASVGGEALFEIW